MESFSELVSEEKHRILICCIMGLADSGMKSSYPNPLFRLGYHVEIMEGDSVLNSEGKNVAPDLILSNYDENHAIIVECKSGHLDKDQIERYMGVKVDDLLSWGISSSNPRDLIHDIALVASYENSGKLFNTLSTNDLSCSFPGLIINLVNIQIIKNSFRRHIINNIFPINTLLSSAPQYLYPLSRESPDYLIMTSLFQSLVQKLYDSESDEFETSLDSIISDLYPYWTEMGTTARDKINRNIDRVVDMASRHKLLKDYISYGDGKIKFKILNYKNTKVMQSFQRVGIDYIKGLKRKTTQTRLTQNWHQTRPF